MVSLIRNKCFDKFMSKSHFDTGIGFCGKGEYIVLILEQLM